jgi:hypothetical protein
MAIHIGWNRTPSRGWRTNPAPCVDPLSAADPDVGVANLFMVFAQPERACCGGPAMGEDTPVAIGSGATSSAGKNGSPSRVEAVWMHNPVSTGKHLAQTVIRVSSCNISVL